VTELAPTLDALGRDLHAALSRRHARATRRRRILSITAAAAAVAVVVVAVAVASGVGPELQLDPAKWTILGSGTVDNGKGEYVHAQNKATGGHSSFSVEHDAALSRYDAFLLHEKLLDAENSTSPVPGPTEPGPLCTASQLTRAESVGLAKLRATFAAGTSPETTQTAVDAAIQAEFAGSPCRGLAYASERARWVFAGREPESQLMPGVR